MNRKLLNARKIEQGPIWSCQVQRVMKVVSETRDKQAYPCCINRRFTRQLSDILIRAEIDCLDHLQLYCLDPRDVL